MLAVAGSDDAISCGGGGGVITWASSTVSPVGWIACDRHHSQLRYYGFIDRFDRLGDFQLNFGWRGENGCIGGFSNFDRYRLRIDKFLAPVFAGIEPGAECFRLAVP